MAPARGSFEEAWPGLSETVGTMLASKKVPEQLREDIVQETGLRLFRIWSEVDASRSVQGLAVTIALNLVRDHARRAGRLAGDRLSDTPAPIDVERAALARLELGRVRRALHALKPEYRRVLLAEIDHRLARPEGTPAAIKVMRLRARRALEALLERGGWGAVSGLDRVRDSIGRALGAPVAQDAIRNGAVGVMAVIIAMTVPLAQDLAPDVDVPDAGVTPRFAAPAPMEMPAAGDGLKAALSDVARVPGDEAQLMSPIDADIPGEVDAPAPPDAPDLSTETGPIEAEVDGLLSPADEPLEAAADVAGAISASAETDAIKATADALRSASSATADQAESDLTEDASDALSGLAGALP